MAFATITEFQDDFRKVGTDATASFEQPGAPANPTERTGSQNLDLVTKADVLDDDDDLEDDDLDEDDEDDDEDDLEDDDLDDEDEDDDDLEDEDFDDDEEDDEDDEDLEEEEDV
jgi:hypothetical protein